MQTYIVGSSGEAVREIQKALGINQDGDFGPKTDAAVRDFQKRNGLTVDGIVGYATWSALFKQHKSLTDDDIAAAAKSLGVDEASVRAVAEVESVGHGFAGDKPVILFERHVFRRQLISAGRDADLLQKYLPEIVNSAPGGYTSGGEHARLYLAKQIDPQSAIESASWGLFQIMGFHWRTMGYDSAFAFEERMYQSEGDHLNAFCRFVLNNPTIHSALTRKDWLAFAANYNGPNHAKNNYVIKLQAAYRKFS